VAKVQRRICEDPNTCDCEWTDREPYDDNELAMEKEERNEDRVQ